MTNFIQFPIRKDVADVCTLREHVHKAIIQVAQKSFVAPAASRPEPADVSQRIRPDQVQVFIPQPQPESWTSRRFALDRMDEIVRWFQTLVSPQAPLKMISWFQLSILFEHQTGIPGIRYKPTCKRYFISASDDRENFVRRSNTLSRWTQGVFGLPHCKVLHLRPTSACLQFWTMCIPMHVVPELHDRMDELLAEHQRSFSKVADLRTL